MGDVEGTARLVGRPLNETDTTQGGIVSASGSSPRILYVTPYLFHKANGAQVRSLSVLRALQQTATVEVVSLNDQYATDDLILEPGHELSVAYTFDVERQSNKGLIESIRRVLDPRSDYPNGRGVGNEAMRKILDVFSEFDLIWFSGLQSADMFPNAAWPCSVVDIDDVPSTYQRVSFQVGDGLRERLVALRRLFAWKRRERLLGDRFSVLTVCSEEDRQYLRSMGIRASIDIIPNGFEKPRSEPARSPSIPPRIGFIGHFSHFPNVDGIHWFVKECWPAIKREVPDARLRVAGPGSDGPLKPSGPDVEGLGWVANPAEEIKTWSLMVVPIRVGAGTRVKIAQGFSLKCPIVSTLLGAHGYKARDGNEMYLADSAQAFSSACIKAIREPEKAAQMAERAWHDFLAKWTWDAIGPLVRAAAEDCLRLNPREPMRDRNQPTKSACSDAGCLRVGGR